MNVSSEHVARKGGAKDYWNLVFGLGSLVFGMSVMATKPRDKDQRPKTEDQVP